MFSRTLVARMAAVGVIAASSVIGVSASQAQAAALPKCPQSAPDLHGGTLQISGSAPYRNGPGENCTAYVPNRSGTGDIYCKKFNSLGNLWYYARDQSSGVVGWIWDGNLSGTSGSRPNCP
jgi:hypothetical protein